MIVADSDVLIDALRGREPVGHNDGYVFGPDERRRKLARYATWTAEDLAEFNEALAAQRTAGASSDL